MNDRNFAFLLLIIGFPVIVLLYAIVPALVR